ncbi:MAG: sensor histidine kinase KdpD [Planctomycetes bacterium]|nr:sensor histidine kinase KdpD [Planctomycetota bacterium]
MDATRPSPEQMLDRARREAAKAGRGRLKIFFGATPGVGKTYAMLEAARVQRAQGVDVVVGLVETHGRAETARLLDGLERLPPRSMVHRGIQMLEFDLDAAIARCPELLLVDELAHTNVPGSRHARRWQDIVELLESGVDVWSTLNVQHIESLNDVVAGITGVVVRETVPDSLIEAADEIEVVDLPPDELLERMREGKVYLPAQAQQAATNFFRKGNLIALRELVLRHAAERVEAQATEYKREHGIDETWRTQERLLVAFDHSEGSADLLRAGRRMAVALRAPWTALTVEDPRHARLPESDRERLAANVALAQRLGAEALVVRGDDVAVQVLAMAKERGTTRILVGRPRRPRWLSAIFPSRTERIVRASVGIDVLVTSGERGAAAARPPPPRIPAPAREYAWAALCVAVSTILCLATRDVFTLADQAMIHLFGVFVASSRISRLPSLFAAVSSIVALNFFFVPPQFTLAVSSTRYIVTFGVMLVVGVAVSRRTVRMREDADAAREGERRAASLFAMSRDFSVADSSRAIARIAAESVHAVTGREALVLVRGADRLERLAGPEHGVLVEPRELAVAEHAANVGRPAGRGTDTLPGAAALYLPLAGMRGSFGVLGVAALEGGAELTPSQRQVLEAFVAQTAAALERMDLREEAARASIAAENERTRSSLLSSVSHDLRTPLAAIRGAAEVLLDDSRPAQARARSELLQAIRDESDRLGRLVGNLLDLTRLDSGRAEPSREWVPVEELVESALSRARPRLVGHPVATRTPKEILEAHVDPVLLEDALVNLLENAARHTPAGTPIEVSARREADAVLFEVGDRGRGVAPDEELRVFERFYRGSEARGVEGSGLGLAVVQAIARVHGGTATVRARAGGGALFCVSVPGARIATERAH